MSTERLKTSGEMDNPDVFRKAYSERHGEALSKLKSLKPFFIVHNSGKTALSLEEASAKSEEDKSLMPGQPREIYADQTDIASKEESPSWGHANAPFISFAKIVLLRNESDSDGEVTLDTSRYPLYRQGALHYLLQTGTSERHSTIRPLLAGTVAKLCVPSMGFLRINAMGFSQELRLPTT